MPLKRCQMRGREAGESSRDRALRRVVDAVPGMLAGIAASVESGMDAGTAMQRARIWSSRQGLVRACVARHRAADIGPVPGVRQPAENLSVAPIGPGKAHIHQVGAAQVGIVDDIDVAGFRRRDPALGYHFQDRPGRELHGPDKDR